MVSNSQKTEFAEFKSVLNDEAGSLTELNWHERSKKLVEYVYSPQRMFSVDDFTSIRSCLEQYWGLTCEEIDTKDKIEQHAGEHHTVGRVFVRLRRLFQTADVYMVLGPRERLDKGSWPLVHELGHLAHHFETYLSLGTLFHRICLRPILEYEIGEFLQSTAGRRMRVLQELEADLFALKWFIPSGKRTLSFYDERDTTTTQWFSEDGYNYWRIRQQWDSRLRQAPCKTLVENLNKRAVEERRRVMQTEYSQRLSPWQRALWVLFNRSSAEVMICKDLQELLEEYALTLGTHPRHVPELKNLVMESNDHSESRSSRYAWLHRVAADAIEESIDSVNWCPLLIEPNHAQHVNYHIPIVAIPKPTSRDSELLWQHMYKRRSVAPATIQDWASKAQSQNAGLLVFCRTPPERMADVKRKGDEP